MGKLQEIEAKMLEIYNVQEEVKRLNANKELLKDSLTSLMEEEGILEHRLGLDDLHDVKAKASEKAVKKIDTEKLADDLGVAESSVKKKDFLMKAVEERKLTVGKYKEYEYYENKKTTGIRRVKA